MAASCTNAIRVRLYFDYPPPSVTDCRMCWVLVDLNKCRVVADLESIIREKFDFSRRSILSLFIEDCYLPHTESIYVVRDNDSIRVKVETITLVNGCKAITSTVNAKKRGRGAQEQEEESTAQNEVSAGWKKRKKRKNEESLEDHSISATVEEESVAHPKKLKKKDKDKGSVKTGEGTETTSSSTGPSSVAANRDKGTKKSITSANGETTSKAQSRTKNSPVSSSSEDAEDSRKKKKQKPPPKTPSANSAPPVAPKVTPIVKTPAANKKPRPPPSSSSSDSDSSDSLDDDGTSKVTTGQPAVKTKTCLPKPATNTSTLSKTPPRDKDALSPPRLGLPLSSPTNSPSTGPKAPEAHKTQTGPGSSDSSDTSSEEEIKLVIKRPVPGLGLVAAPAPEALPAQRGRGLPRGWERGRGGGVGVRGGGWDMGPGGRGRGGRGEGRGPGGGARAEVGFDYGGGQPARQQNPPEQLPSHRGDSLTNNSVVFNNPPESAPKRDYSTMPLLAAPPQVGQKIAFKLLELTENYTPEVSEYKEGRIISFDYSTKQIELELLSGYRAPAEPGKFDLVYQNADGSEDVEYAVTRGSRVTERWESLLEPRLVMVNIG
ncbi:coilin [Esox lucius]|uniref:Coilin n=1 Tax=Esox lucius TaxID=8010 RepID=A0A3P8ZXQ8_ESOLU|nr:coilin [Esox lucius]